MKSKDVLRILNITRPTLCIYVKKGKVKVTKKHNGHYDYDAKSVYELVADKKRYNVIYARVSTKKQKKQLDSQIKFINDYCVSKNVIVDKVFRDISSGMTLDRKEFNDLMDLVVSYKIDTIFISNKDRLSRTSYSTVYELFNKFGVTIVSINDIGINKTDEKELVEDIISLLHSFAMKTYSKRKKKKFNIISEDLKLEI